MIIMVKIVLRDYIYGVHLHNSLLKMLEYPLFMRMQGAFYGVSCSQENYIYIWG